MTFKDNIYLYLNDALKFKYDQHLYVNNLYVYNN